MATKKIQANDSSIDQSVVDAQNYLNMSLKWADRNYIPRLDRMVDYYELNHYHDKYDGQYKGKEDRIKVPYPYANTQQIRAEVIPINPEPIVRATRKPKPAKTFLGIPIGNPPPDPVKCAQKLKEAIKYAIRHSNYDAELNRLGLYGISTGFGAIIMRPQKNSLMPRWESKTHKEVFFACYAVKDPLDSPWFAFRMVKELKDVQNDDDYNDNKSKITATRLDPEQFESLSNQSFNPSVDYCLLWEYYDLREDKRMVFPDGQKINLLDNSAKISDVLELPPLQDHLKCDAPIVFYVNEDSITSPIGLGDIYPMESQVRELDKTRSQQINHRKRFNRKYLIHKGFLTEDGKNQLKNPDDGTIVETNNPITTSEIQPLVDAPMSSDVYHVDDIIQRDIQITQPIGPNSLVHGVGAQPDTLGQSQIIEQNANTRLEAKRIVMGKVVGRTFMLTAAYIQQYWVTKQDLLIQGEGDKEGDWLSFVPGELKGEYEYDVVPESMKDNTLVYRKQTGEALQIVAPLLPACPQSPSLSIMVKKYLETFETLEKDVDKIIPEQWTNPPPLVQTGMPGQPGAESHPTDQLLQEIQGSDPQAFLDKVNSLPDNERQVITDEINKIMQGQSAGAPTNQSVQVNP